MGTEHLQKNNWIRRYEALNTKALDKRTELIKAERVLSKSLASTLPILKEIHEHLKAKPICQETEKYPTVQEWVEDWVKPLLHVETRQAFHLIGVAKHLVGKVTTEELEEMGIENAKSLSEVARSKGKVTKEQVDKAITLGTKEFKGEVRKLLYGKASDHAEGKWEEFVIRGPKEWISDIQKFLKITRLQAGNGPSDAELIALVVNQETNEIVAEEAARREKLRGVASAHQ
jgi:hypothetical protein